MDQILARWAGIVATLAITFIVTKLLVLIGWNPDPEAVASWTTAFAGFLTMLFIAGWQWLAAKIPWLQQFSFLRPRFLTVRQRDVIFDAMAKQHGYGAKAGGDVVTHIHRVLS